MSSLGTARLTFAGDKPRRNCARVIMCLTGCGDRYAIYALAIDIRPLHDKWSKSWPCDAMTEVGCNLLRDQTNELHT